MIMLEGPDLAGKTTLAKQLTKMMRGSEILHRGPPESQDPFTEYLKPLEQMYYEGRWPVLDRWHWGETIYGPILRGRSMMDTVQQEYIEMACMRYGVSRLLLLPSYDTLMARFDEHGDDLVKREQMIAIATAYQKLEMDPRYSVHRTLLTDDPFTLSDLSHILAEAMGYRSRANIFYEWPSYIGPTRPHVLFIGEKPAESHRGEFKTAFVPYAGTSGHHLLRCLNAVDFRGLWRDTWRAFGFVNAYDGCDDFLGLWNLLECPRVVTLGRKAFEAVYRFDVSPGRAPHPQFARRFYHAKVESYGEALVRAVDGKDVSKWKG